MLDLKQLTTDVCQIATEVGHFLKEERKNFRRERVEEKHAHDYVYEEGKLIDRPTRELTEDERKENEDIL